MSWYELGVDHGWDAANYDEAYGTESSPELPATLATGSGLDSAEERELGVQDFTAGWLVGGERYRDGQWQDGTDR